LSEVETHVSDRWNRFIYLRMVIAIKLLFLIISICTISIQKDYSHNLRGKYTVNTEKIKVSKKY